MPQETAPDSQIAILAGRTLGEMSSTESREFSLALIIVIIKLIFVVFECLAIISPKTIDRVKRPGILVRWKLHRLLKGVLQKEGQVEHLDEIYQALLTVGQGITEDELRSALIEILGDQTAYQMAVDYELI